MIGTHNDGTHDYGYDCSMPREITFDGVHVDDSNHPENYQGMYILGDPGGGDPANSPFPYARCEKVIIRGLTTASGMEPRISPNAQLEQNVILVEEESSPNRTPGS